MIWASVFFGVVLSTVSLVVMYLALQKVCDRLSDVCYVLDRMHEREKESQRGLVDRILSGDWEQVRLHEGAREVQEGGFFTPEEQKEDSEKPTIEMATRGWGHMNAMKDRFEAQEEEQRLLEEDFPELIHENR